LIEEEKEKSSPKKTLSVIEQVPVQATPLFSSLQNRKNI
jgi:hypothetical protein